MPVDYTFYTEVYAGALVPEKDFLRTMKRAEEILETDTFGRAQKALSGAARTEAGALPETDSGRALAQAVKMALCALAELCWRFDAADGGIVVKEAVGGWSREYAPAATPRAAMREAEARYLGGTGLLYRGRTHSV